MKRVGILGGTFNPIHNGHLMMGQEAYNQLRLDYVLVMPNRRPAYKQNEHIVNQLDRINMVKLAIEPYHFFHFSDIELNRDGNTYTVDTLKQLHFENPGIEYYFILGADSLDYLDHWYQFEEILKMATIVCIQRNGISSENLQLKKLKMEAAFPFASIMLLNTPFVDISSTEIRNRISNKESIVDLVPQKVAEYIYENHLYVDVSEDGNL